MYNFNHLTLFKSSIICLFMSILYVVSLYLWSHKNRFRRESPDVIKRRFISVLSTSIICLAVVYLVSKEDQNTGFTFDKWIGLRIDSTLVYSVTLPLILTMALFAGPISQLLILHRPSFRIAFNLPDIYWWRNVFISPLTEEIVFRACMIPLMIPNLGLKLTVYLIPLVFGLAHLHHIIESIYNNADSKQLKIILLERIFQLFYTYLFGLYSAFIFVRCANIIPCILCHSFCNYMGFPNIIEVINSKLLSSKQRILILSCYFAGVFAFVFLIRPITEPSLFDNQVFVSY